MLSGGRVAAQGVGMVLPIEASMASRAHFDLVLSLTMGGITALYIGFGLVRQRHAPSSTQMLLMMRCSANSLLHLWTSFGLLTACLISSSNSSDMQEWIVTLQRRDTHIDD